MGYGLGYFSRAHLLCFPLAISSTNLSVWSGIRPRKWRFGGREGVKVGVRPRKWRYGGREGVNVGVRPRKW